MQFSFAYSEGACFYDIWSKDIMSIRRLLECDIQSIRCFISFDVQSTASYCLKLVQKIDPFMYVREKKQRLNNIHVYLGQGLHRSQVTDYACFSVVYFFFQNNLEFFRNTIKVSNSLDPDQARHLVVSDLGPTYL